jgi:phenylalanyl-tRNA synthetase beta chain
MVLDENLKEGMPLIEALGLDDVIMEIAITPNRSDALSHIGIARDLAAIFNRELKIPELKFSESEENIKDYASVVIEDTINCPRYTAKVITNVSVKESPEWLKNKLRKIGLRPINNIVDVTNFVMNELGQPLHAFDLDRLAGKKIIVKSTNSPMKFTTLDSKERTLPYGTLMICDAEKEVAIAGVMGGENSEVTSKTKNILLESAHFNPSHIRRVSKSLGLSTDASYRFERVVDPDGTEYAANRAAILISELSGGKLIKGSLDIYPNPLNWKKITLRISRVEKILGYHIPEDDIRNILINIGLDQISKSDSSFVFNIPLFRPDLEREIDLIEEIARIYGYEKIPAVPKISVSLEKKYDESSFTDEIRETATALGFYEIINNPLVDKKSASFEGNPIKLLNEQSIDMAYLRSSLIPGALNVVANNINKGEEDLKLFEIGNVFIKKSSNGINSFDDFEEKPSLLLLLTGKEQVKQWNLPEKKSDFFSLKGLVDSFIMKFSLDNVLNDSYYHDGNRNFAYYFEKRNKEQRVGFGGKLNIEVLKQYDISQDVFCFQFDISELKRINRKKRFYTQPIKYPVISRDFAFIVDQDVTYNEFINFIKNQSSKLLKNVKLFDLFESESLGRDKKSLAFNLHYQSEERTLTESEVENEFNHLISKIEKKFNAKLRGI